MTTGRYDDGNVRYTTTALALALQHHCLNGGSVHLPRHHLRQYSTWLLLERTAVVIHSDLAHRTLSDSAYCYAKSSFGFCSWIHDHRTPAGLS